MSIFLSFLPDFLYFPPSSFWFGGAGGVNDHSLPSGEQDCRVGEEADWGLKGWVRQWTERVCRVGEAVD